MIGLQWTAVGLQARLPGAQGLRSYGLATALGRTKHPKPCDLINGSHAFATLVTFFVLYVGAQQLDSA